MPEALARIKRELGPDAVILGTRSERVGLGPFQTTRVEITAAPPDTASPAPRAGAHAPIAQLYAQSRQSEPRLQAEPRPSGSDSGAPRARILATGSHFKMLESTPNSAPPLDQAEPRPSGSDSGAQSSRIPTAVPDAQALPGHVLTSTGSQPIERDSSPQGQAPHVTNADTPAADPLFQRMIAAEMSATLAAELLREARSVLPAEQRHDAGLLARVLRSLLEQLAPETPNPLTLEGQTRRIAFVGPSGAGKTTTIAKLAAHFTRRTPRRVVILALDCEPAERLAPLRYFAELLDVALLPARTHAELRDALEHLGEIDLLLIDTFGVGPRETGRFARLGAALRILRPDETHLVLPATTAPAAQARIAAGFAPFQPTHLALTRLDECVGAGVVLEAAWRLKTELSLLSNGQDLDQHLAFASHQPLLAALLSA